MTTARDVERAERAKQLLGDDLFAEMLTEVRQDAFIGLSEVKASDIDEISRLQAVVAVTDGIKDKLMACILATGESDGGYSMTDSPQGE